jgi:hypothetical protein
VSRVVDLAFELTEVAGVAQGVVGIEELVVVEDVGEDGAKFSAEALAEHDVFLHAEVDVPERLAAKIAGAAVAAVVSDSNF